MSALGLTGKFKCEKKGLYLISAYLMTETQEYVEFHLYKNGGKMSGLSSPQITSGTKYRTSTFLTLQSLNINDVLEVRAAFVVNVYDDNFSCLSFLQLTNN
ncbi:Hypothetical predicted protein [Mytilus galloprovincialis]|uniref:C1q domain-containing protein n=1 Tax=Mytilus galloprovincialis TaxID=29158 RepID=A0A8B6C7V3_MYTGA|nr:Hypothetical predicted protein [Mytilus galloprovincialis]